MDVPDLIRPTPDFPWCLHRAQVVVEFAKGASGFRLFAAMVENDLVVTNNPAKFASPVRDRFAVVGLPVDRSKQDLPSMQVASSSHELSTLKRAV